MDVFKKIVKYLVPFLLCAAVTLIILGSKNSFAKSGRPLMGDLSDAFFVPGAIMAGFGLIVFATNGGAFDMLAFGVIKLFDLFKRDMTKVKYRTFYDYRKAQSEKKRAYLNFLIVGCAFVLLGAIFLIVYFKLAPN